jgi:hypothetical protein
MAKKAYVYDGTSWIDLASSATDLSNYALLAPILNAQTGTTYTLVLGDSGEYVEMNNSSSNTVTIPLDSSVNFPVGAQVTIISVGAGLTTIAPTSGVTLNYFSPTSNATAQIRARYSAATAIKRAANNWLVIGNLL